MRKRAFIIFVSVWLLSAIGWSCQVPVFRYALERWSAEKYRLVVMHKKPLGEAIQKELITLQSHLDSKTPNINMTLEVVNIDKVNEQARWSLPDFESVKADPWMVLVSPDGNTTVHSGSLSIKGLSAIHKSPARDEWLKQILAGGSVVWLVIPGEDKAQLENATKVLNAALARAENEITIPEGVLRPEDLENGDKDNVDMEDVLRSGIPLKIQFPTQTIDRNDPCEVAFVSMLTQGMPDVLKKETLIVPLFGRGRMLQPLPASRISEELIMQGCSYLCGACSCTVKDNNPGLDIIVNQDWQKHLNDGLIVIEKELPPLEGVGDLAYKKGSEVIHSMPPSEHSTATSSGESIKMLLMIGGGILSLLVIGTFVLKSKSKN